MVLSMSKEGDTAADTGLGAARLAWLDQAIAPAIDLLLKTGEFSPTLYLHGAGRTQAHVLDARDMAELRDEAVERIREGAADVEGYVLLYPSTIRFGEKPYTVLIVETAGSEDAEADELARRYWREEGRVADRFDQLGRLDNLLDRA